MTKLAILTTAFFSVVGLHAADDPAVELYFKHCAQCHEQGLEARVPTREALGKLSARTVLTALETGVMREMGTKLTPPERRAVAGYLGKTEASIADNPDNRCPAANGQSRALPANAGSSGWTGWGGGLNNWRFQNAASAGLGAADIPKLKLKWAFGIPDTVTMRSQPAVYADRVFVAGPASVYSLNAMTGCMYWSANAAGIRSGLAIAPLGSRTLLVFANARKVTALDAATGQAVWDLLPEEHPAGMVTDTPIFHAGKLYIGVSSGEEVAATNPKYVCCTFRGSVVAIDAATGKVIWKTYTIAETPIPGKPTPQGSASMGPSGAGIWSTPTIDTEKNALYVTTGDNYSQPASNTSDAVLALSLDSGKLLWSKQFTEGDAFNVACGRARGPNCPEGDGPDFDFGASPMLLRLDANRRVLVAGQKSGMVHGLDPDQEGKILWQAQAGEGGKLGGIQWGMTTDGTVVYASRSGLAGDPKRAGGLYAFRADNGERMWMTPPVPCGDRKPCSMAQSQAVTAMTGVVFSGSNDGHFRAYSTSDGKVIFDYDTAHEYQTVNGVPGKGGALDVGGPVIANGMIFVNSGYASWGGMPGNVVLAFGKE